MSSLCSSTRRFVCILCTCVTVMYKRFKRGNVYIRICVSLQLFASQLLTWLFVHCCRLLIITGKQENIVEAMRAILDHIREVCVYV